MVITIAINRSYVRFNHLLLKDKPLIICFLTGYSISTSMNYLVSALFEMHSGVKSMFCVVLTVGLYCNLL